MWTRIHQSTAGLSSLSLKSAQAAHETASWRLLHLTSVRQQHVGSETFHDQKESFGFAPDELDLAHLDQTQASSAVPASNANNDYETAWNVSQYGERPALPTVPESYAQHEISNHQVPAQQLTHLDSRGRAQMVDVGQKQATTRSATASAVVQLNDVAFNAIASDGKVAKGDALTVAQLAGIMGAKQTSQLIPLCHNIPLDKVNVELSLNPSQQCIHIEAMAKTQAYTGVEMEAMVGATVAALTVYDMCKALDKGISIQHVRLETKTGGKSGDYHRQ